MTTLYDLLGALPDDDADGLRAAFRKAAKASHPDVNPGNPEAAQRFRRIVRANAILSDEQQRAAYDQLLEVARRQQSPEPKRSNVSGTIRRLATDAIASAAVSVLLIGGYVLFRPVDGPSIAVEQHRLVVILVVDRVSVGVRRQGFQIDVVLAHSTHVMANTVTTTGR